MSYRNFGDVHLTAATHARWTESQRRRQAEQEAARQQFILRDAHDEGAHVEFVAACDFCKRDAR